MTQKEKLEHATGLKMPEPTEQELKKIQLQNSPFWIIGNDQKGYNIIMGKWKLNKQTIYREHNPLIDQYEEIEDMAKYWLQENQWNIQLSMIICAITDLVNNQNKQ